MRAALAGCALAAIALVSAAGCGESPEDVFAELKTAALEREPKVVWNMITPDSRQALAGQAERYFRRIGPAGEASGITAESRETYEYLAGLMAGLDADVIEYIRSLGVAEVEIEGDTALVALKAFRFDSPEQPLVFRKIDGRWLWDARETLETHLQYREHGFHGGI